MSHTAAQEPGPSDSQLPSSRAPQRSSHHECTCLGQCCATAPSGLPVATPQLTLAPLRAIEGAAPPAYAFVPTAAEYLIPFANGPPVDR
jgi:hypothetical protein